jgi:hypothetical protein
VKYDPASQSYIVAWFGTPGPLDVFDSVGRYSGSIGQVGQGPGEFPLGASRFFIRDGLVTVYGYPTRTWTTFRLDGTVVEQRTIDVPPQDRVIEVSPELVLMTSGSSPRGNSPLIDAVRLEVVGDLAPSAFGVVPGGRPFPRRAVRGRRPSTITTLTSDSLVIHEVDLAGTIVGMIRGEPAGFPVVGETPVAGGPPPTTVRDVAFDREERLWLVTGVPADTWRDFRAAMTEYLGGATGPMEISMDVIYAMPRETAPRLDVFDLEGGVHLGSWISEERSIGLMDRDAEVLVHQMEIGESGNPYLAVYRMF